MINEQPEKGQEIELNFLDVLNTIRRRFLLILLVVVVFVFGSILRLQDIEPIYKSTATLLVQAPNTSAQDDPFANFSMSELWKETYVEMIKGDPVIKETVKRIYYPVFTVGQIRGSLSVEAIKDTLLLKVSSLNTNKGYAKKIVDTVCEVFIEKTADLYKSNIQASTKKLEKNINDIDLKIQNLQKEISETTLSKQQNTFKQEELKKLYELKSILDEQLSRQIINEQQIMPAVKVYQDGTIPTAPSNMKDSFTISIAAILGLFIGLLLAFLLEFLDDTIKTEDDIKRISNLRVLGVIPRFGLKNDSSYYSPYSQGKYYK